MEDLEDFTYVVQVGNFPPVHFREVRPKDFYFSQTLRLKEASQFPLVCRLILNIEIFHDLPISVCRKALKWASENVLNETIMTVENWLEVGFHLCKQRWDQSMDWLEEQPMSKILTMIELQKAFNEKQEDEMKKASRRGK